ncbi:MAG: SusD/RagB family nutrient-binding outer membrane lipoprotein [Pedobacter sp.]|nr:MAG: SusD/RagB family nutrient-binding outer membrane lipoprotein [Pedobacter sp.]
MKKFLYFILPILLLTAGGCKKEFLDINENPNSPTDASITPELILPRALVGTGARMATSYSNYAGWMGYWARSGTYGPSTEEESYNITTTFEADEWSGWYDILFDYHTMEKKAQESGQTFYQGIAKIMKTIGFMYLVDQYNNVPYFKAFDLAGNIQPAYDKGEAIYADLLVQLSAAKDLIKNADVDVNANLAVADIMFQGDKTKWIKFANTQHLKLLLRQSQVPNFNPAAEIAKINATGAGYIGSGESANIQPGYAVDNGKQNPYWNTYKRTYTGAVADQYWRANNHILGLYRNNNDIRYQYVFSAAQTPLNGNTYYGFNYGEVIPNSDPYKAANSSDVAGPGLAKSATQPQWILTSVEALFLRAEAIQRGWIAGDAKTAYEAAVRESFIWLGVTNATATANTYLNSGQPIVDWATAANKLTLIITQKYLAMIGINNFEAWVDYRRLGVPSVPKSRSPSVAANIPVRLRYPQDEYNYNAGNVASESNPDPLTSPVFWDK